MLPITLYIHIPFCLSKCPYCSFFSLNYLNYNYIFFKKYILILIKDLFNDFYFKNDNRLISSIYIGGGTPTLLNINLIELLLEILFLKFKFIKNLEITIETNILDINKDYLLKLRNIGINRISIGVQSFNNYILKKINRNYNLNDIIRFIYLIRDIFEIYSIDLIYGLPNQNISDINNDLKFILILKIPHISWYELYIDKYCYFYNKKNLYLPNKKKLNEMYFLINKLLLDNNYINYSISCFSLSKFYFCNHNINYWKFGDYIGIGCSSHSKITILNDFSIYRFIKNKNINDYLNKKFIIYKKKLNKKNIIIDYFINRFRLNMPFKLNDFTLFTGLSKDLIIKKINLSLKSKFLYKKGKFYYITKKGFLFNNNLLEIFF